MKDISDLIPELEKHIDEAERIFNEKSYYSERSKLEAKLNTDYDLDDSERYGTVNKKINDYEHLINDSGEVIELAEMAKEIGEDEDLDDARQTLSEMVDKLKDYIMKEGFTMSYDSEDCFITFQMRDDDTKRFDDLAGPIINAYKIYMESKGIRFEEIERYENSEKKIIIKATGENAYGYLRGEEGIQRIIYLQERGTRNQKNRPQTSLLHVYVTPDITKPKREYKREDFHIEAVSGTGAGGQHVNRNLCGVRITHKETGMTEVSKTKSLKINERIALSRLYQRLDDHYDQIQQQRIESKKTNGDFDKHFRTHNYREGMVTDHELGERLPVQKFLEGKLDKFIHQYRAKLNNQ